MITNKDFYLLRTPLLPVNFLVRFLQLPYISLADEIKQTFTSSYLAEAIYIASPELSNELTKWQSGILTDEKEVNKLVFSLFRYLLRMSTRCTPYGLFAGCSPGTFDMHTAIHLNNHEAHLKHCRLDMNYVAELTDIIVQLPEIKEQLLFFPNNSLYSTNDTYRYAAFTIKDKFRHYDLTSVSHSQYLKQIFEKADAGATIQDLSALITSEEITYEEACQFIEELITNQLLISELEPTITGEEFFNVLIRKLETLHHSQALHHSLSQIQLLLTAPSTGVNKYLQIHTLVKKLLPDTNNKDLVQTDLFLSTSSNVIKQAIITDIQQQMISLWKLSPAETNADLRNFCNSFRERYEEQEIPLAIALDTEAGIGYGSYTGSSAAFAPLLDDLFINPSTATDSITWNKLRQFQVKSYQQCMMNHQMEIELTDTDLDDFQSTDNLSIPDSFYLMGSIVSQSAQAVDNGDYLFDFNSCGGPSAANLLGRFCHGDTKLKDKVKACLDEESHQQPDVIYAEIIHLPEARTGNILMRPQLRDYEIVYLGKGSVCADHQIPISDLMISIQHNHIILRSKKLNKRVIPRLSTAHNFSVGSLPVYKFLCDLQFQQLHHATGWQWHLPMEVSFLPRVRYKKIILNKCTWTLHKKDYPSLAKQTGVTGTYALFNGIREKLRIPRYVAITERDNELFIDMENESCIQLLANTLLKKDQIILQEILQTPENCWIEGTDGHFTNELIIPFKNVDTRKVSPSIKAPAILDTPRNFITGSEWLYVKIYAGANTTEKILKSVIKPLVHELQEKNIIDKWFFIRYADPEDHIRIRFHHTTNTDFWKTVLEQLYLFISRKTDNGMVHKIQTDTYIREIERYGAETMVLSETIFQYDSEAVLGCIDLLDGEEGENYRWLLAIRGVDMLLQDFGYTLQQMAIFMKRVQQHFFQEFGGSAALQVQLNTKYRKYMRQISSILDKQQDAANDIEEAIALLQTRSLNIRKAIYNAPVEKWDELISSYIHMFLNRMLLSNQRKHELVIYHFLSKYYDSRMAILKQQAT